MIMPALTLQQQFGANATLSGGILSISLVDLTAIGLNNSSPSASEIAAALILLWKQNQGTEAANDATIGVVVGDATKSFGFADRANQIQHQFPVSLYVSDSSGTIDPDNVI